VEADGGTEIRARPTVPHLARRRVSAFPGGFRSSGSPLKTLIIIIIIIISRIITSVVGTVRLPLMTCRNSASPVAGGRGRWDPDRSTTTATVCFTPLVREKCCAALVNNAVGCVVGSTAERFGQEDIILFFAFGPVRRGQNDRNKNVSRKTSVRFRGGKDNDLLLRRRHTDVGLSEAASAGRTRNTHTHMHTQTSHFYVICHLRGRDLCPFQFLYYATIRKYHVNWFLFIFCTDLATLFVTFISTSCFPFFACTF